MEKAAQDILMKLAALQAEKQQAKPSRTTHPDFELDVKVGSYRLLAELVGTSYRLGGALAEEVWKAIRDAGEGMALDGDTVLEHEEDIVETLMDSDCSALNELAAATFTHVGLAFGIPEVPHPFPVALDEDEEAKKAAELLRVLKRDGTCCPLTDITFYGTTLEEPRRNEAVLTHIIPLSVFEKPETLAYIKILSSPDTQALIQDLASTRDDTTIMNSLALQADASQTFKEGLLGIQYLDCLLHLTTTPENDSYNDPYVLRTIAPDLGSQSLPSIHNDGSTIHFGRGLSDPCSSPIEERHGRLDYPHPLLCNLRYEIACALQESGARALIARLMAEANQPLESPTEEIAIPHPKQIRVRRRTLSFLGAESTSERVRRILCAKGRGGLGFDVGPEREAEGEKDDRTHFCEVLSAKLMICGRAAVMI